MNPIEPTQPERDKTQPERNNTLQPAERNQILRRELRLKRKQLTAAALALAERKLITQLKCCPALLNAQKVASYQPQNGEISPRLLEQTLAKAAIFYPSITHFARREMRFYSAKHPLRRNALGISEPMTIGSPMPVTYFDAILVPLVAFDRQGNRLGMGAGFYDRALSCRLNTDRCARPLLIGLAHHFQEVKSLTAQSWDVPLDAILTDVELITSQ